MSDLQFKYIVLLVLKAILMNVMAASDEHKHKVRVASKGVITRVDDTMAIIKMQHQNNQREVEREKWKTFNE